jgi:hypothetical protein
MAMAPACQTVPGGLEGFPTWIIGGEKLKGEQTFEQLEAALARASDPATPLAETSTAAGDAGS